MKKISIFFVILLLFLGKASKSNEDILSKRNFSINDLSKTFLSEIGLNKKENIILEKIFFTKEFEEINNFFDELPVNNPNPVIQDLIYKVLISKKVLNKRDISPDEDKVIFEKIISQLFNSGRLNEIELFYSQTINIQQNEEILIKMIEGNFLRNRHTEACKILENKVQDKPVRLGKIMVICDILNNKYEQARLGLALLKEQNNPGDIFFIELAFSLMSENQLSESDYLLKTLNEIKKLNPVVMTSLQFADISPNFEQIQNLSTSGLLFILSNPTVETDLKIHCAELLVKQGRISFEMLSEAYQLPRYDNADIENAIKLYKTLSPIKARPLLYQSILRDENPDSKYIKIKALLKASLNEKLFKKVSFLVDGLIDVKDHIKSDEDAVLFSKMFQAKNKFYEAKQILKKIEDNKEKKINQIAIDLNQFLTNQNINMKELRENLADPMLIEDNSEKLRRLILVMLINMDLDQDFKKIIKSYKPFLDESSSSTDLKNLFFAQRFSSEKDFFNSLNTLFRVVGNKDFSSLNLIENFSALIILKNLGLDEELKKMSASILL
ncbi:MAG: hypothetical protein CMM99_04595 [Rickettsiales bacterium]|nr:hypothetical protein [Rickettsiales bacterium]